MELTPRVVVLAGGLSYERDVSLRSGHRVADALRDAGLEAVLRDVDADLVAALPQESPAVVFPVLHGASGEDGAIRAVLELLGVPYVGSRPEACRLAFDKAMAKTLLARAGVATPRSVVLNHATFRDLGAAALLDAITKSLGLPLVVKPNRGGSALGTSVVRHRDDLPAAMVEAYAYDEAALIETMATGTEVTVTVLDSDSDIDSDGPGVVGPGGPGALPAVEIVPDGDSYDYAARYTAGATEFFVPARLDDAAAGRVAAAALTAHRVLGLRHLSRTDLIVDDAGLPWFLEVNVAPGMTETSLTPQAVRAAGLELGEVCRTLVLAAAAGDGVGTGPATG
jgi:D-alanine-D-alanine ligase